MNRAAAIQMASGSNIKGNLLEAEKQIANAVADGAELIVLPENFGMIGAKQEDVLEYREVYGSGPLQDFLAEQASKHAAYIVGGTVPLQTTGANKYRNSLLVYNRSGENIARYDKIHLFDVTLPENNKSFSESDIIEAGNGVVVVDIDGIKLGLTVCYDLRFPELFRLLLDKGAEVMVVPSAFTSETGKSHWHALLKARAIENLSFVIAAAQGGYHVNGCESYGHSLIIDPWGKVLDEISSGPGFAIADLNFQQQKQVRDRFPSISHRKFYVNAEQG